MKLKINMCFTGVLKVLKLLFIIIKTNFITLDVQTVRSIEWQTIIKGVNNLRLLIQACMIYMYLPK